MNSSSGASPLYRIVLLGEGGVGKTAIAMQFCLNHFIESYDPTIEDSYRKQVVVDGEPCLIEILDTAGQEEFIALRDQWIRDGQAFLLIYSVTSKSTFNQLEKIKSHITRAKESESVPILLIGNKCDRTSEIEVTREQGQALAKKIGAGFMETSAKTGVNIEKAFYELVRRIKKIEKRTSSTSNKTDKKAKKKKCVIL